MKHEAPSPITNGKRADVIMSDAAVMALGFPVPPSWGHILCSTYW